MTNKDRYKEAFGVLRPETDFLEVEPMKKQTITVKRKQLFTPSLLTYDTNTSRIVMSLMTIVSESGERTSSSTFNEPSLNASSGLYPSGLQSVTSPTRSFPV